MPWAGLYRYWLFAKVTDALRRAARVPRETISEVVPEIITIPTPAPHPWLLLEPWECSTWNNAKALHMEFVPRETIQLSRKDKREFIFVLLCCWIFKLLRPPIGF